MNGIIIAYIWKVLWFIPEGWQSKNFRNRAYIWIIFLGTLASKQGWVKIIHRTDRCDLSLFQLGLRLLEHFLNCSISIPVTFQLFNPLK